MTGPRTSAAPGAGAAGAGTGPVGVLVMAHGTPAAAGDIEAFYTRIRRGRPPTPEQLADLERRYRAIGGTSPLAARTAGQVAGLAARLEEAEPGRYVVAYGAKHTEPSIEEAAASLARHGASAVVGLVLAPHRASMGSEEYLARAAAALGEAGELPFVPVRQWYDAPGLAALVGERVEAALASLPPDCRAEVLFTAHSLPERVVAAGDPYPEQVAASAALAAGAAGLDRRGTGWRTAWQSAGRTPERWLGPDLVEVVRSLPAAGVQGVVVCPIGFVADHLEVLYDVDVEARGVATGAGLAFARTASLDDDPRFIDILAGVVRRAAGAAWSPATAGARG